MTNPFNDFWQASELNKANNALYGKRMSRYNPDSKSLKLLFPNPPTPLKKSGGSLEKITKKRVSGKSFSDKTLTIRSISRILQSLSTLSGDLEHRTYPSAGASYSVETFIVGLNGPIKDYLYYYHPEHHGLTKLHGLTPTDTELKQLINIEYTGTPTALVLFVGYSERVVAKYDQRGYRFMLIEAGAMLQQLSLAIASDKHATGCAIGGLLDNELLKLIKQTDHSTYLLTGYILGHK